MATIGIVIESEGGKVKEANFGVITAAPGAAMGTPFWPC